AIEGLTVPDTIKSVILSRIDRLHGEVRYVLQCAAVIGRVFQRSLLEYLAGQMEELEDHLARLEAQELVYRERIVPELEYAFKHALTQETAYEGILARNRRVFHERVAEGIEALYQEQLDEYYELLAFHYRRSDNTAKAIEYLIKAGDKAAERYANAPALRFYQHALDLIQDPELYDSVLDRRAKLLLDTFQGKAAVEDYERLLERARERGDEAKEQAALLGLGRAHYVIALDEAESDAPSMALEHYE